MSFLDNLTAQIPFRKKSEDTQYYFAINIGLSEVTAAVWGIYSNNLDILGSSSLAYVSNEDLLEKVSRVLDKSLSVLEIEPQKVLFGVPEAWSIDDNLKEPYLKLLRKILKEYDLEALAYVTTTNAISFILQKQEGIPPTVILFGVGDFVEASLIRAGKVAETRSVKRGDHLFSDIEKTLTQFSEVEVLPSKILLYKTKTEVDLDKIRAEMMSYPWMQKLSFLHFPKIDIFEDDIAIQAVISSGALEINPQINLKHHLNIYKVTSGEGETGGKRVRSLGKETAEEGEIGNVAGTGFVKGDIKKESQKKKDEDIKDIENEDRYGGEELEDDNLVSPGLEEDTESEAIFPGRIFSAAPKAVVKGSRKSELLDEGAAVAHNTFLFSNFDKFTSLIPGNFSRLFSIKSLTKNKIIFAPAIIILLLLAYIMFVKVSVTVFVEPKILENEAQVVADPQATSIDEDRKIIPGSFVETTVSGSGKTTASGTKQIGDPARGKVVIYNMTDAPVSFSQGAVLVSGQGLKFTLDTSVKIASQSSSQGADYTTTITPGKTDPVAVTASAIGPESNLPAASNLSIGGFSQAKVIAKVSEALSGGTSKNVSVVTSDDQKKLQAQVLDDLRQKAQTELQGKVTGEKKIIPEALIVADGKYNFNKQVNDQAGEFSLSASVHFKGTAYSDSDLRTIVSKLVATDIPENYQLNLKDTETQADVAKTEKDGKLIFKAKFRAKLLPKFNANDIKNQIKGKSISDATDKLKQLDNVIGSEIKFTPKIPIQIARMPLLDQNISITVSPK